MDVDEKEPEPTAEEPKEVEKDKPLLREYQPRIPYPARLKQDKNDHQYGKFLDVFKQLRINLPFVEAMSQMPKYAKFLKDLLSNKRKLEEVGQVTLNEECSAILQNKLPEKKGDPGSFTIPCVIGELSITDALADLGASINLLPSSMFDKLGLIDPKPTRMSIQLADRSVKYPRGIVENVLVQVDKFIFPVDFVVMDMAGESKVPLILGRPFLATARALIDVGDGKLQLRVGDESVTFDLNTALRHSLDHDDTVYSVDVLDDISEFSAHDSLLSECVALQEYDEEDSGSSEGSELSNENVTDPVLQHDLDLQNVQDVTHDREYVESVVGNFEPPRIELRPLVNQRSYPSQGQLNPPILEIVHNEYFQFEANGNTCPILDENWVSLVQLIPKALGGGLDSKAWRSCTDFKMLKDLTRSNHSPMHFLDLHDSTIDETYFYSRDYHAGFHQFSTEPPFLNHPP